jgi:hypothetical protein
MSWLVLIGACLLCGTRTPVQASTHVQYCPEPSTGSCISGEGVVHSVNWNAPIGQRAALKQRRSIRLAANITAAPPTVALSPAQISGDFYGYVQLTISGLDRGETVRVEKFQVNNTQGEIPPDAILQQSFLLTDGKASQIAGLPNPNIPGDITPEDGSITARLSFLDLYVSQIIGQYVFRISSPAGRFSPVQTRFQVVDENRANQRFIGKVQENGRAIPHAFVALLVAYGDGFDFVGGVVADATGQYEIGAYPDFYHLVAVKPGSIGGLRHGVEQFIDFDETKTVDLKLFPATRKIVGRLVDVDRSEHGLAGLQIVAISAKGDFTVNYTDADGFFDLAVTEDVWEISVPANALAGAGYLTPAKPIIVDTRQGDREGLQIGLPAARSAIYGQLTNDAGEPLPYVEIAVFNLFADALAWTATDENGRYFVAVTPGAYGIQPQPWSLESVGVLSQFDREALVPIDSVNEQNFALPSASATISGLITYQDGEPDWDVTVVAVDDRGYYTTAQSDDAGEFRLSVSPGNWYLYAYDAWYPYDELIYAVTDWFDVARGASLKGYHFKMRYADAWLETSVRSADDKPLGGIDLYAYQMESDIQYLSFGTTGPDGLAYLPVAIGEWFVEPDSLLLSALGYKPPVSALAFVENPDPAPIHFRLEREVVPKLAGIRLLNGTLRLSITGSANQSYLIQKSNDLKSWSEVGEATTDVSGQIEFSLTMATSAYEFYRLVKP